MNVSDNVDISLFASRHGAELARRILRVKRNDPAATSLRLPNVDYSSDVWGRLGDIVGDNDNLSELNISHGDPDVARLCAGLRRNRSLRRLDFLGVDLWDSARMSALAPFLEGNRRLSDLQLAACNLSQASVNVLADALSGCSLERLNLCCNYLSDVDLDALFRAVSGMKTLTHLRLSGCGIGPRECASLAAMLRDPKCNLTELRLNVNSIDDECTILLTESLSKNTKLKELALNGNVINAAGWSAILNLVCDTSSIGAVTGSNHTLCGLGMEQADLEKTVGHALNDDDANLLRASLKANEIDAKTTVMRRKVTWSHARGDVNLGESRLHTGAMPRLLAGFGGGSTDERTGAIRLDSIYRIVSSMPELGDARAWFGERRRGGNNNGC